MPYSALSVGQIAAQGADIRFVCRDCGASVVAPIAQVLRRFGDGLPLGNIQARAVCRHCNSIDVILVPASEAAA
jgi:hypothetical protein